MLITTGLAFRILRELRHSWLACFGYIFGVEGFEEGVLGVSRSESAGLQWIERPF
jgi:hypothetical protein